MIILVDMDGVVADFEKGHRYMCRVEGLPEVALQEGRTQWDILAGIPDLKLQKQVLERWHRPGFFLNLPVIPGALEAVHVLNRRHQVFFCTAPLRNHATCASEKISWIQRNFPGMESNVIITGDKTLVHGDILIDDRPEIHGVNSKPSWEHKLYAQPYNKESVSTRWTWPMLLAEYAPNRGAL